LIRQLIVRRLLEQGRSPSDVAEELRISRRTVHKWMKRFKDEGLGGLEDRSSRPATCRSGTPASVVRQIERLRKRRLTAWERAERLQRPPSTVSRILKRLDLGRLWRVEESESPEQRYEHERPGPLRHIDAKKLGKLQGIGHRIHGDRRRRARCVGWELVFVAVDDHTRLAYAEVLRAADAACATRFLKRALR
jgi:transposase